MVVKTEKCAFSEYPIFPGHGMKFVRKDGQPIILSGSKSKSLYLQRMKSSKLMWTQAWRRLNKKGNDATVKTKRSKRTVKLQRAIVGVSLEAIEKVKSRKPHEKSAAREAALKEVKERNKKAKATKMAQNKAAQSGPKTGKQKGGKGR